MTLLDNQDEVIRELESKENLTRLEFEGCKKYFDSFNQYIQYRTLDKKPEITKNRDLVGNVLSVGDWVLYIIHEKTVLGRVVELHPKSVKIQWCLGKHGNDLKTAPLIKVVKIDFEGILPIMNKVIES